MSERAKDVVVRFDSGAAAEMWLEDIGFSVGRLQRDEPRGLMFGDYDVMKWRNLRKPERRALDGVLTRLTYGPDSAVQVRIYGEPGGRPA